MKCKSVPRWLGAAQLSKLLAGCLSSGDFYRSHCHAPTRLRYHSLDSEEPQNPFFSGQDPGLRLESDPKLRGPCYHTHFLPSRPGPPSSTFISSLLQPTRPKLLLIIQGKGSATSPSHAPLHVSSKFQHASPTFILLRLRLGAHRRRAQSAWHVAENLLRHGRRVPSAELLEISRPLRRLIIPSLHVAHRIQTALQSPRTPKHSYLNAYYREEEVRWPKRGEKMPPNWRKEAGEECRSIRPPHRRIGGNLRRNANVLRIAPCFIH